MSLLWTSTTIFRSDDKTNPAEAGFINHNQTSVPVAFFHVLLTEFHQIGIPKDAS